MSPVSVPFGLPRWLTATRVAICAVTLAGAAAAMPASVLALITLAMARPAGASGPSSVDFAAEMILAISVPTTLLSAFHAWRVEANPEHRLFRSSVRWAALLGALNPGLIAASAAFGAITSHAESPLMLLALLFGCVVGALPGVLLGICFGIAFFFPLRVAVRAREAPAHDAVERALVFAGIWLAGIGTLAALLPLGTWPQALGGVAIAVGLSGAAAGALARARRRRWLRAVVAGKVADFAIASGAAVEKCDLKGLIPFYRRRGVRTSELAVLIANPGRTGAYRSTGSRAMALLAVEDLRDFQPV